MPHQRHFFQLENNMRVFIILLITVFSLNTNASDKSASTITAPITALFDAMRNHDAQSLKGQFTSSAMLQRVIKGGDVKNNDINKFAEFVGKTPKHLDEKLLKVVINQSDNLASVWTPYVFYLDNKLSHCGVNSFQLVKTADGWKIAYLIDNMHQGDCQVFMAKHSH